MQEKSWVMHLLLEFRFILKTDYPNKLHASFPLSVDRVALADESQRLTLLDCNHQAMISTQNGVEQCHFSFAKLHGDCIARIYGKNTVEIWDFSNPSQDVRTQSIDISKEFPCDPLLKINAFSNGWLVLALNDHTVILDDEGGVKATNENEYCL